MPSKIDTQRAMEVKKWPIYKKLEEYWALWTVINWITISVKELTEIQNTRLKDLETLLSFIKNKSLYHKIDIITDSVEEARKAWVDESKIQRLEAECREEFKKAKLRNAREYLEDFKNKALTEYDVEFVWRSIEEAREAWSDENEIQKLEDEYKKELPKAKLRYIEILLEAFKNKKILLEVGLYTIPEEIEKARKMWADGSEIQKAKNKHEKIIKKLVYLKSKNIDTNRNIGKILDFLH